VSSEGDHTGSGLGNTCALYGISRVTPLAALQECSGAERPEAHASMASTSGCDLAVKGDQPKNPEDGGSIMLEIRKDLLARILTKTLRPGDRINENQLSIELDVSRSLIRQALRSAELSHLVEIVHNKGAFVRKPDLTTIFDLYDVRAGLAYTAGKILARRATMEQIAELYALYEEMEARREAKDPQAYVVLNERFHATIMNFTGNQRLIEWSRIIDQELRVFLRGGTFSPSRLRASNGEHLELIKRIDAGDPEGAGQCFENHVTSGRLRALESIPKD
jgi:DNA-binding GntR family transcriptional regulator